MTKRKPDQVIEYRVSLQDKQSEQLDGIIAAFQINKIGTPLVALLSDASAMTFVLGVLELYGIIDLVPDSLYEQLKEGTYSSYQQGMDAFRAAVDLEPQIEEAVDYSTNLAVKAWIFLMTTGRILVTESETR